MKSNSLYRIALAATVAIGTGLSVSTAAAQSEPLPLNVYIGSKALPNAYGIAEKVLDPASIALLRETNAVVQAEAWSFEEEKFCVVHTGLGSIPPEGKTPRASLVFSHSESARRSGESAQATCERAFEDSLKKLQDTGAFARDVLVKQAELTSEPGKVTFATNEAKKGFISYWTGGTLNEKGDNAVVKELGARWHEVLDYRKFSAHVFLMTGETMEGKSYCLVRYGITSRAPQGRTGRVPQQIRVSHKSVAKGNECSGDVVYNALGILRDSYSQLLADGSDMSLENGVTYPSAAEVQKKVAKFDADAARVAAAEAKKAAAEAKKAEARQVASTTRSTNRVTCQNECYNGNCIRTFPDGRKERWQAPRKYDPFTQNWGWDTTTNACGI